MPRTFLTERDIEDLARSGVKEIEVNDGVYITDVAREKMEHLGLKVKPGKPVAPGSGSTAAAQGLAPTGGLSEAEKQQVMDKVKSGVLARHRPQ